MKANEPKQKCLYSSIFKTTQFMSGAGQSQNCRQTACWEMQPRLAPCSCSTQAPCRQHVTLCKLTATHTSKRSNITQNNDARLFLSPNCWWTLKVLVFKPAVDDGRRCRKAPGVHVRRSSTFHLPPSLSSTYNTSKLFKPFHST